MSWLEALECYLNEFVRPFARRKAVIGATIETAAGPPPTPISCELVGGWWVEERVTVRGNFVLHLFPSVV